MQEGGVYRSQPVEVALRHQRLAYLDAPYNDTHGQYG
jgi:hypothetical protein